MRRDRKMIVLGLAGVAALALGACHHGNNTAATGADNTSAAATNETGAAATNTAAPADNTTGANTSAPATSTPSGGQ